MFHQKCADKRKFRLPLVKTISAPKVDTVVSSDKLYHEIDVRVSKILELLILPCLWHEGVLIQESGR